MKEEKGKKEKEKEWEKESQGNAVCWRLGGEGMRVEKMPRK